jgi:hypothetical protein
MDDLTQEEINLIMSLRKNVNDHKIQQEAQIKTDKEKMSVFMPLYFQKKHIIEKKLDLQKKITELDCQYTKVSQELSKSCVHYAHPKQKKYEYLYNDSSCYECPACKKYLNLNANEYTNVWDEKTIIYGNFYNHKLNNDDL